MCMLGCDAETCSSRLYWVHFANNIPLECNYCKQHHTFPI